MKLLIVTAVLLSLIIPAYAAEPPKIILLKDVTFDHEGHKGECISCHLTSEGKQKIPGINKEWAHKTCMGCHTVMGAGPTVCKECHSKVIT